MTRPSDSIAIFILDSGAPEELARSLESARARAVGDARVVTVAPHAPIGPRSEDLRGQPRDHPTALRLGLAPELHRAIEACAADWICLLDAGTALGPGWLDRVHAQAADPSVAFVPQTPAAIPDAAAPLCIHRDAFLRAGGLDEAFGSGPGAVAEMRGRLPGLGIRVVACPGSTPADPDDGAQLGADSDAAAGQRAGRIYAAMKSALSRLQAAELPVAMRQALMAEARRSVDGYLAGNPARLPKVIHEFGGDPTIERCGSATYRIRTQLTVTLEPVEDPLLLTRGPPAASQPRSPDPSKPGGPLISCLMVTRGAPGFVGQAVRSYLRQTLAPRELVIVHDSGMDLPERLVASLKRDDIRVIPVPPGSMNLGELRNLAVEHARGTFVCQWDDDDLYDATRLERQHAALRAARADACMLHRWSVWWPGRRRIAISARRDWEGTLLCAREVMPRYPAESRGEDTALVERLRQIARVTRLDQPHLYVYVVHGGNTWHDAHFERMYLASTARFEGSRYDGALAAMRRRFPIDDYPVPAV